MMNRLSAANREATMKELERGSWDVLVIGGGITGAGIALDAAARGMRTALIDMQDFAAGTSSRSTKLVHGGLRYLKQFEVAMVAEVGKERAVVYELGPHVTTPEPMLLPIYKGGSFGWWSTSLGLKVYDALAGVKKGERRRMLGREETLAKAPLLRQDGLLGGGLYVEYRTDDARLTIEVVKKAAELGALAVNYAQAEALLYESGRLIGAKVVDRIGGGSFAIKARKVVNATGPWVDTLREKDGSKEGKALRLTKGVHLVFDGGRFPLKQAVYFDTPDGRMVFAIPRDGKTYAGTTDTDYVGDTAHPDITVDDRDYVLNAVNGMFPSLRLTSADTESGWAGLRPLIYEEGKSPSEISRKDEIFHSPSGMLTIAGGKLTGYRKMAQTVTDMLARELAAEGAGPFRACNTKELPISGGNVGGSASFPDFVAKWREAGIRQGLDAETAERLARRYGSNTERVLALLPEEPIGGGNSEAAAVPPLPRHVHAELLYAIEHEMAVKPADFLIRRTGALLFDVASVHAWKDGVLRLMAEKLGYTEAQLEAYGAELNEALNSVSALSAPKLI